MLLTGKSKIALIVAMLMIIFGVGYYFLIINEHRQVNPIPDSIRQQVDYSLYYPAKLSADFHFNEVALDNETGVTTYKYTSGSKTIFFSMQKKPEDLNYEEFRNKQMVGVREIKTSLGIAYAGTLQNQTVSSLLTDNTWIFITAGKSATIDDLEKASKSLEVIE